MWQRSLGVPGSADQAPRGNRLSADWEIDTAGCDFESVVQSLEALAGDATETARLAGAVATVAPGRRPATAAKVRERLGRMQLAGHLEPACQPIAAYLRICLDTIDEHDVRDVAGIYARECAAAADRARQLAAALAGRANHNHQIEDLVIADLKIDCRV
jgi:hypothetical protein